MRGQPGYPLCSRNARSRIPLVGRAHYGDQPGYPRRESEKEKARIEDSVRAFVSQDSVGRREVRVPLEAALERNCAELNEDMTMKSRRSTQARFNPAADKPSRLRTPPGVGTPLRASGHSAPPATGVNSPVR